jgi:uncharacterized surface protein with fasciclin (FAS1) repeats
MKSNLLQWSNVSKTLLAILFTAILFSSCRKDDSIENNTPEPDNQEAAVTTARMLEQTAATDAEKEGAVLDLPAGTANRGNQNIVQIALSNPHFTSLVAAAVKTDLAGALSNPAANLTVFAPTNAAFAKLPAPFNNATNIASISNPAQINFLKSVLLYHVLGTEVFSGQISQGSSSAMTIKPRGTSNDNTLYFSKRYGLIRINGRTDVIWPNLNANNGVVHVINNVLLFPDKNIAEVAIGNPAFSSLVAALVKTNLAGVFTGDGDFTVFAPTNDAFAKLPAPFNNATNIGNISDPNQIAALANILKYHVIASRQFNWDFGILKKFTTLANAPDNKLTTILGYNTGWVKGNDNNNFSQTNTGDILTTNGVIHVVGDVLLP